MKDTKTIIFFCILIGLAISADEQQPVVEKVVVEEQVVTEIGKVIEGNINIAESNQKIHLIKTAEILSKYLFLRVITSNPIRMSIGIYQNETKNLVYACEDTTYDSCYVPGSYIKKDNVYAVLVVSNDNMEYNFYSYWGDLQHIKPNQQIKFMFDKLNPTQLFHLQFGQTTKYEQIRIVLKPQAAREQNDNLKVFANRGLNQPPTQQKYDYQSLRIWRDAQAIFLSKRDLAGENGITLYIVGNAQTVYNLQCQFIEQISHVLKISQTLDEFLPKGYQTYYSMNFKDNGNVDSFVIKIAVFTGELEVGFFYDKEFKNTYEKLPFQYMSDMQFNFQRENFLKNATEIFMRVRCPDSSGIYQIITQARNKQLAFEISQNVYEFSVFSQPRQAMYFFSHIWDDGQYEQQKLYRFDVSIIKIFGATEFQFYMCNPQSTEQQCKKITDDNYFSQYVSRIKPIGEEQVGSKILHTLQFNQTVYKKLNVVQKKLMIIILVNNKQKEGPSAYAAEFSNPNKIRLLRESRAFEDKVRVRQKKYYKYLNSNPTVSQIRIHVNEISGLTRIRAKRQDIFTLGNQIPMQKQLPDTIVIKDRVVDPIYLQIYGVVTSLYTISVSALHSQHVISNALVMAEDVEYEVKLSPYQQMIVELHPIESDIMFEFYSEGGPVSLCEVSYGNICEKDKQFGSHGEIKINTGQKRQIRLRLGNFNKPDMLDQDIQRMQIQNLSKQLSQIVRKIKLTLIYHSDQLNHCDQRRINKVYSQNTKYGTCLKFHLPLAQDIQIMLSRSDLGQNLQNYFVCKNKVIPSLVNNRFIIKGDTIQQNCKQSPNDLILQIVVQAEAGKAETLIKMDYSIQYQRDIITLSDGVAYLARGKSIPDSALRTFFYEIIDETRDINIVLFNKKGNQKFIGLITNKWQKYNGEVTEGSSNFTSKTSNYYSNPYIQIKGNTIGKANCGSSCVLVISVYSSDKQGTEVQYALEVTQNNIYLNQNQIKKGFLPKGSVEFYEYQCRLSNESLIFQVSDNNRKCATAILSKSPFPTQSNYIIKQNQGTIIYSNTQKGTVYFAVQAIQDCPYSVSVSEQSVKITKIEHGQFYDIKLEQGQEKWFYHRHLSKKSFKIISLQKHGEINIFANKTDLNKTTLEDLKKNKISPQKFAFKSFSKNTLIINELSKQFCDSCYYIICIKATKLTQSSIMIGSQNTKIFLTQNKILYDQMLIKNSITYASFYRVSDGNVQLKVHSGKINLEMSYNNEKMLKKFTTNKKQYKQKYNFTRNQFLYQPIQIKITAEQVPALYSFELVPTTTNTPTLNQKINPGQHTYLYLSQGQSKCIVGTIVSADEEIFISAHSGKKLTLSNLNLDVKLNNKNVINYVKQLVNNILSIKLQPESQTTSKTHNYTICMKTSASDQSLSLIAFQNKNLNLIHSDTQVLVRKSNRFVLYPSSDVILDLFQCKGNAQIYYGPNLQTIRSKQSHKLDVIGIPGQSHAIKIQAFSALYLDVVAEMATILWMPINSTQERGIGYFKYAIGGLGYDSRFNAIDFKIGSVYKSGTTATKPKIVKYTLFLSNSKELLQQAVMCQKTPKNQLISATVSNQVVGNSPGSSLVIEIDKKRITDQFSSNETLYFNVVADMTLQVPQTSSDEQNHEHYRFIYYEQIVPSDVFRQNKLQQMNLILLIVLGVVGIVGFLLISCTFVKYIIPALGRLKNRVLVQEKEDPRDRSLPIPPASERNQVVVVPSNTDQELQK